jgi:hypothetical protein
LLPAPHLFSEQYGMEVFKLTWDVLNFLFKKDILDTFNPSSEWFQSDSIFFASLSVFQQYLNTSSLPRDKELRA